MKIKTIIPCVLLAASSIPCLAIDSNPCPNELVNFWKNFAVNTDNYSAIPVFLLKNECFRARVSTEFHSAMMNRFDQPENPEYVTQLYAQLNWDKKNLPTAEQ